MNCKLNTYYVKEPKNLIQSRDIVNTWYNFLRIVVMFLNVVLSKYSVHSNEQVIRKNSKFPLIYLNRHSDTGTYPPVDFKISRVKFLIFIRRMAETIFLVVHDNCYNYLYSRSNVNRLKLCSSFIVDRLNIKCATNLLLAPKFN